MTPDLIQLIEDYRANKGSMINFTFLADGGVQVSIQNGDKQSWSCGMGESVEEAVAKAFRQPKQRTVPSYPPMPDSSIRDDEDDFSNLI